MANVRSKSNFIGCVKARALREEAELAAAALEANVQREPDEVPLHICNTIIEQNIDNLIWKGSA